VKYIHADKSARKHDPDTNWNLWVRMMSHWVNVATAPTPKELRSSFQNFKYAGEWGVRFCRDREEPSDNP